MADWAEITAGNVICEDSAILVLNKPAGISVTGERHDTDLVRLAAEAGQPLFPVHRIDKVTSGAVLFAKDLRWHGSLTRQFADRTAGKDYLALTRARGLPESGTIDLPLSAGRKGRVRVAAPRDSIVAGPAGRTWTADPAQVFSHVRSYPSVTTFARVWEGERHTLLLVRPVTGRRHQIRVHLAWIGHPIEGDPLFGSPKQLHGSPASVPASRVCLHSWRLAFDAAWRGGTRLRAEAEPGLDFWAPVAAMLPGGSPSAVLATARRLAEEAAVR